MSLIKCAYCGCTEADCLAQSPESGLYFCNGKGVTPQSHIIHFLKQSNRTTFALPPTNRFHNIDFKCYICSSKNIFKLGFVRFTNDKNIYITCRQPCQFEQSIHKEEKHTFTPLISNGQIISDVVRVPKPSQYKQVSIADTISVLESVNAEIANFNDSSLRLEPAKLVYDSLDDFGTIMTAFINAEKDMSHELEKNRVFGDMRFCWDSPKQVSFSASATLVKAATIGSMIKFTRGDINEIARVKDISKSRKMRCIFDENSSFFDQSSGITVSVVYGDITFERQLKAVNTFVRKRDAMHYIIKEVLLGDTKHLANHNRVKGQKIEPVQPPTENGFPVLNQYQLKAIKCALRQRFTMIQGPPGTGKTTVIAATVTSFLNQGLGPILVLCQTNIAADFATKRIIQTGSDVVRVLSFLRESIGYEFNEGVDTIPDFDIMPYTSHQRAIEKYGDIFEELCLSPKTTDKNRAREMERDVISEYKVVCTTCGSAGGIRLANLTFPIVIYDESSQCLDPDILIGAVHGAQQLILVGDHRQLGPVVLSRAAAKARYDISIMKRLTALNVRPSFLKMQYRMHPAISLFPSTAFYKGLIIDAVEAKDRTWPRPILPWPDPANPIFFWNIDSKEENYDSAISYINTEEASAIAALVDMMVKNGIKSGNDIGIITPYTGQQMYLIDSIDNLCKFADTDIINEIEIASVDSFQGREKNFIIFSCVRANDTNDIGFLKDLRRLCVSFTRAKYGFVIVGNANTFAKNVCWSRQIENLISRGLFVEGDLDSLKLSTFTSLAVGKMEDGEIDDDDDEVYVL